jgi:addiction module HigA family antidote
MTDASESAVEELLSPIPPGEILREEFLRPHGLTLAQVARDLDVNTGRLSEIVHGRARISAEMALRLGRYFGTSPELWLGLQMDYEMRKARRELWPATKEGVRTLRVA